MTDRQFKSFQKTFMQWQSKLGLAEYTVSFVLKKLPVEYATCEVSPEGCVAEVTVSTDVKWTPKLIKTVATHECIHLLLARLTELAHRRFVDEAEIFGENERVTCILEKVLCPKN